MTLRAELYLERGDFTLDATLSVAPGEIVAVLGPSGAGKSTLLAALAGLVPLAAGRVTLDGQVLEDAASRLRVPPEHRSIGMVFQDYLLFPHLSALDNVAFGLRCQGLGRGESRRRAGEWLTRVGLAEHTATRPGQLSGGQAQRVALARALAVAPRMLLLDEPLSALDVGTRADVRRDLRRALGAFPGVRLMVTHDPTEAMALADHLVIIEAGRVVQSGTPAVVTAQPRSTYVARVVGVNLLRGDADGHQVIVDGGDSVIVAHPASGPVFLSIHPRTVSLHTAAPRSSARNVLRGRVRNVDVEGDVVRVDLATSPPVVAEVTIATVAALDLKPGADVWATVKATEVDVYPA